jgi:hypothetical protein
MADTMSIDAIVVGQRHRKDLGNISDLAESIRELGLLQPVGVSADGRLLFGERRLAACRLAGLTDVPVHIVTDLHSAADRLMAERDENTCRKDMTPQELVELGLALEEIERPKARGRQGGSGRFGLGSREPEPGGRTYEIVAPAVGMSPATYKRAKHVVEAANDEAAPPEVRQVAQEAVEQMNATGIVTPAYDKVRQAELGTQTPATVRLPDTPDNRVRHPRLHRKDAEKILSRFLTQINGIAAVIEGVDFSGCRLSPNELSDLDAGVRVILSARKTLRGNSK